MTSTKPVKDLFAEQFWRELQAAHNQAHKNSYDKVVRDAKLFETMLLRESNYAADEERSQNSRVDGKVLRERQR